jgi:arsenate reductase
MKEVGVDISGQRPKGIDEIPFDRASDVIGLCGEAAENRPAPPQGSQSEHWPLPDPTLVEGDEETLLQTFRQVRDEIRCRVENLFTPRTHHSVTLP